MLLLLGTILYGVLGYTALVDEASIIDGLYWTFLTIGGVGFRDTERIGDAAELFSISLIILVVAAVAWTIGIATDMAVSGDIGKLHGVRRRRRMIDSLSDHYVICGYGRVGHACAAELERDGVPYVVADPDGRHADELSERGIPFLVVDPSHEAALLDLGIMRARGLVCAVDSDAVNVFITLTARGLNPGLTIVARAAEAESVSKLQRAGADAVVSPYEISGRAMARRALDGHHPAVSEPPRQGA